MEIAIGHELGYGRIKTRKCSLITDFKFIENDTKLERLTSIIKIESIR